MSKTFYITTTLPYVNARPHLGFALEIVLADVLARFHEQLGEEVYFNTGTDEHGQKLYLAAEREGVSVEDYVARHAAEFRALLPQLGISDDIHFIRTTEDRHQKAAQAFWQRCLGGGDIYKHAYKVKYCVGCELEKTDSELVDDSCPLHPGKELEILEEENYFFRFSRYQKALLGLYDRMGHDFVVPRQRLHEIREFVSSGLKDFSVSRLASKMPWGIPVPGDDTQVMYVWFDALINYISTLGWPDEQGLGAKGIGDRLEGKGDGRDFEDLSPTSNLQPPTLFEKFWPGVQIAGKDNLRQQAAMWQAMLMSAGLPTSKQIIIHGFITSGGQKMSKTVGNVVDPFAVMDHLVSQGVAEEQARDALRFWLCHEMSSFEDGDFTMEEFIRTYNTHLANGLGNLVSRVLKMAVTANIKYQISNIKFDPEYAEHLGKYRVLKAAEWVWGKIKESDEYIAAKEPFKKMKVDALGGRKDIEYLLGQLDVIVFHLLPLLPDTAKKIQTALANIRADNVPRLFPRI